MAIFSSHSPNDAGEKTSLLKKAAARAPSSTAKVQEPEDTRKKLSAFAVALLTFSCAAGGPFGIEVAVNAGGALTTIFGLAVAGILWGYPQALMTAELAAAIPANGGPVVWTRRAFGAKTAWITTLLLVFNQITDIVLYPTLFSDYVQQLFKDSVSDFAAYLIKLGVLAVCVILNIIGVDALASVQSIMTAIIMTPIMIMPIIAAVNGNNFTWDALGTGGIPDTFRNNIALWASTIFWNMQGWSEIGCLAGDIADPEKVLPPGLQMAAVMVTLAYACPIAFGVALAPDLSKWEGGYLVAIANDVAPWLSVFMLIAAALASLSTFLTTMAAYSRTLQASARQEMIPLPFIHKNMTKYKTPVPAILFLAATTAALGLLDFTDLVVVDSCFYVISNMVIKAGFLRLKYKEPNLARPYRYPCGMAGAWSAVIATELLAVFAIWAVVDGDSDSAVVVGLSLGALVFFSLIWDRWYRGYGSLRDMDDNDDDDDRELSKAHDEAQSLLRSGSSSKEVQMSILRDALSTTSSETLSGSDSDSDSERQDS